MSQAELELYALFEHIRATAKSELEKGRAYERIIRDFLKNDSEFKDFYEEVLSWVDFTLKYGGDQNDTGIDLVAKDKNGHFTAIQCKFYKEDSSLTLDETKTFFNKAGVKHIKEYEFTHKIIATTAGKLAPNLIKHIEEDDNTKIIGTDKLIYSNIDWKIYLNQDEIKLREKLRPKKHQEDAINAVIENFNEPDTHRGKLIMACGTGKTLTGLRYIEKAIAKDGLVLIAMPSIALISQTIREYCHQAWDDDIYPVAVCSQDIHRQVREDEEDMQLTDLLHPTSTAPNYIADYVKRAKKGERCIVFTTYQSMDRISQAQKQYGLPEFDLIIADEAHRTAGSSKGSDNEKSFTLIHNDENVKAKKRLYMTATPRVFSPMSQKRAESDGVLLYSMDDEEVFGKSFYELSFGRAVNEDLLSDYKILVTVVDDAQALGAIAKLEDGLNVAQEDVAKMIGIHKAIGKKDLLRVLGQQGDEQADKENWDIKDKKPMKRVINFTPKIIHSKRVAKIIGKLTEAANTKLKIGVEHIDGTMNSYKRENLMRYLREENSNEDCRMLTNAKCLTEGVDVPALDGICFYNKKKSFVDIIQAVGRVLRKSPGKEYGYIILPVCIDSEEINDVDKAIRKNKDFEMIWQVLAALKAHDESMVDKSDYRKKMKVVVLKGDDEDEEIEVSGAEQLSLDIGEKIFNAIVDVAGETAYWKHFGEDVEKAVRAVEKKLRYIVDNDLAQKQRFEALLESFKKNIQQNINEDMLFSTLAQHATTEPIFDALFAKSEFVKNNPIALALNNFLSDAKKDGGIEVELEKLDLVYKHMAKTIKGKDEARKQEIIDGFYNSFLTTAFPKLQEQLGIVYTPIECVDFILRSTENLLQKHFNSSISAKNVSVLDPFTGTGTFIIRLLSEELNLIKNKNLLHKYKNEIHANELILLAYYIALLRIETAFNKRYNGDYIPFQNAVFGDTFDSRTQGSLKLDPFKEVGDKWERQNKQKITVITGNPPYSAGQNSEMENNKNASHPELEDLIKESYVKESSANNRVAAYDSYYKALRWSTNRIQDKGMISFIVNGSFIDSKVGSGIRACFGKDFSHIYIMNLKGNTRKRGEEGKREGGQVFGPGSRATIAIIFLVKDGTQDNNDLADIQYFEIDSYLEREQKLEYLKNVISIENINAWEKITPNKQHSWINQEDEKFEKYITLGNKDRGSFEYIQSIFSSVYTIGMKSSRDIWVMNFSKEKLAENVKLHIKTYSDDLKKYIHGNEADVEKVISNDTTKIKYTLGLKKYLRDNKEITFNQTEMRKCLFFPFQVKNGYCSKEMIESPYKTKLLMPNDKCENIFICTVAISNPCEFSAIATNILPTRNIQSAGQCFPLYYYEEEQEKRKADLTDIANDDMVSRVNLSGELQKKHAITEWVLEAYRKQYKDNKITRLDIFHYIYGIFHSPEYKKNFANNLRKDMPRIPFVKGKKLFQQFSEAGKKLMKLHLNYEKVKPYKLDERIIKKDLLDEKTATDKELYRVTKMKFGKGGDKATIIYNDFVSISGIPPKAYEYMIEGFSAIEWIMKKYTMVHSREENISQDPNDYSDDPKYIFNLLKSIITLSVDTVDIVDNLPKLDIEEKSEFYSQATKF